MTSKACLYASLTSLLADPNLAAICLDNGTGGTIRHVTNKLKHPRFSRSTFGQLLDRRSVMAVFDEGVLLGEELETDVGPIAVFVSLTHHNYAHRVVEVVLLGTRKL